MKLRDVLNLAVRRHPAYRSPAPPTPTVSFGESDAIEYLYLAFNGFALNCEITLLTGEHIEAQAGPDKVSTEDGAYALDIRRALDEHFEDFGPVERIRLLDIRNINIY